MHLWAGDFNMYVHFWKIKDGGGAGRPPPPPIIFEGRN